MHAEIRCISKFKKIFAILKIRKESFTSVEVVRTYIQNSWIYEWLSILWCNGSQHRNKELFCCYNEANPNELSCSTLLPVMSSRPTPGLASSSVRHRSVVSRVMTSFRRGEDSTWQWLHAWLQYRPMFTTMFLMFFFLRTFSVAAIKRNRIMLWSSRRFQALLIIYYYFFNNLI